MDGDLELLGERIAEHSAHLDAAMHRLLTDLREFDQRGGWHLQGAVSCAHWLAWRVGWDLVTARQHVRVARKLADLPAIDDALRRGEVSYAKVRAMVRVATPANQSLLLAYAQLMTASQLEIQCRKYALVLRHGENPHPLIDEQRRYVRRRDTEDGMVKIEAVLHPEEAELVWTMLNHAAAQHTKGAGAVLRDDSAEPLAAAGAPAYRAAATSPGGGACGSDDSAEPLSRPGISVLRQREDATKRAFSRADALVSIAQSYLRSERPDRAPVEITLTISESSLRAETVDPIEVGELGQSFVPHEAARRLSCDAGVVEVVEDATGTPLSVGRKRRTISGPLKRALYKRDQSCTYPGCTHRIFLEGHHIKHWADGGETSLENAALLCSVHHRYVHEYGYSIELGPDHRPRFRDPRGRLVEVEPERPERSDLGWPWIRAMNEPLAITADKITCWDGTPVDHGTIVGHLLVADGLTG